MLHLKEQNVIKDLTKYHNRQHRYSYLKIILRKPSDRKRETIRNQWVKQRWWLWKWHVSFCRSGCDVTGQLVTRYQCHMCLKWFFFLLTGYLCVILKFLYQMYIYF